MRYKAVEATNHTCCYEGAVADTTSPYEYANNRPGMEFNTICECYTMEQAEQIAKAMNLMEAH